MLSDAPAHNVFVLLGPTAESDGDEDALPDILAIVQTSLEGKLSRKTIQAQLARGHRSAGDLIPWTMSQQFGDGNFAQLSGARVVRVAVHPAVQGLGYGSRAMELLFRYYNGEMVSLNGGIEETSDSENETPSESESEDEPASNALIHKEALKPRKKLVSGSNLLLPVRSPFITHVIVFSSLLYCCLFRPFQLQGLTGSVHPSDLHLPFTTFGNARLA
jgi:N-acetyltransferase 10